MKTRDRDRPLDPRSDTGRGLLRLFTMVVRRALEDEEGVDPAELREVAVACLGKAHGAPMAEALREELKAN